MGITKYVLKRPVTTLLAILCLIVFGYQSVTGATLELTPDMDMSMMIVLTTYQGASPDDVNELVTKPIEDAVGTLSGLDSISSRSSEGMSMIMLEYQYGTDMDEAYDDLKKKVDQVASRNLPEDADTPAIIEMSSSASADMTLVIDNQTETSLYNYVENEISPEFETLSDVAEVAITGGSQEYIRVELMEEKMKQYGVTISSIASDIAAADLSYPAGSTKVGSQEFSVSTKMNYDTQEALAKIPLTTSGDGIVYLEDVAAIYTHSDPGESIARYNGNDTVSLQITRQQSSTSMALSGQVQGVIQTLERTDPDLHITVVNDNADSIVSSLKSVAETLIMAIVISMVIIWLFFGDLKASLIVGSSIPVSILASLIAMNQMGLTLNVITLSALTLGGRHDGRQLHCGSGKLFPGNCRAQGWVCGIPEGRAGGHLHCKLFRHGLYGHYLRGIPAPGHADGHDRAASWAAGLYHRVLYDGFPAVFHFRGAFVLSVIPAQGKTECTSVTSH